MRRLSLPLLALALAACDGPTETPPRRGNEVDFAFTLGTGASGTFVSADDHAYAARFGLGFTVYGVRPRSGGGDAVTLSLPQTGGPGVVPLGIVCGTVCQSLVVLLSIPRPGDGIDQLVCSISQGEVRVERADDERIVGSFSGSGECQRSDSPQTVTTIQIRSGDFDVRVL